MQFIKLKKKNEIEMKGVPPFHQMETEKVNGKRNKVSAFHENDNKRKWKEEKEAV